LKLNLNIFRKFALVISAFFLCTTIFGQAFGELLPGSSSLIYDEKAGVHKLLDGANFIYQGNTMYADSAYYLEKNKIIRAYGNVHIRKSDNVNLYCDSLYYFSNTGLAHLYGKVRAIDAEYRLTADSMVYNTRNEQGIYRTGGKIENLTKNEVLTSKIGYFYPNAKNFFFRTNVVYTSDDMRMTTDSLLYKYAKNTTYFYGPTCISTETAFMEAERGWYNMNTEEGSLVQNASIEQESKIITGDSLIYSAKKNMAEGFCNVFMYDFKDSIAFSANYAIMDDSLKYSLLTDEALIIKYQKDDTIHIHADTLYNKNDSLDNRILTLGYHGVKIFGRQIQGMGDSLSYAKADGYMELYKKPILWAQNGELKGDSMRVYMNDSIVQEARIWGKATAVMEVDSGNYYNQMGGNYINAYFKDNEIYLAKVIGNAQTVFFPEEEAKPGEIDSTYYPKKNLQIDSIPTLNLDSISNDLKLESLANSSNLDSLTNEIPIDSLSKFVPDSLLTNLDTTLIDVIQNDSVLVSNIKQQLEQLSSADTTAINSLFEELNFNDSLIANQQFVDSIILVQKEKLTKELKSLENKVDSIPQYVFIKRMGMNRFYASEIKIYFDSGEVVGVTYYEQPDGVFYPMDKINKEEQFITNFATNFALRPKSVEELFE